MMETGLWGKGWKLSPMAFGDLGHGHLNWFEGKNRTWVREAKEAGAYEPVVDQASCGFCATEVQLEVDGTTQGFLRKGMMWFALMGLGGAPRVVVDCDFEFRRNPAEMPACEFGMALAPNPKAKVESSPGVWVKERNAGLVLIRDWSEVLKRYREAWESGYWKGHFLREQKCMALAHIWMEGEVLDRRWQADPRFWDKEKDGEPWAWHYIGPNKEAMGFKRKV